MREECGITERRRVIGGVLGGGGGKAIFISPLCPIGIEIFTSLQTKVASMGQVKDLIRTGSPKMGICVCSRNFIHCLWRGEKKSPRQVVRPGEDGWDHGEMNRKERRKHLS